MDYSGLEILDESVGLVLYTCDMMPTDEQAQLMDSFVRKGGRIHGASCRQCASGIHRWTRNSSPVVFVFRVW